MASQGEERGAARPGRAWVVSGTVLLAAAAAACVASVLGFVGNGGFGLPRVRPLGSFASWWLFRPPVVFLGSVVPQPWHLAALVTGVGATLVLIGWLLRLQAGRDVEGSWWVQTLRRSGIALLLATAGAGIVVTWYLNSTAQHFVLGPVSAHGCRIVAEEQSLLWGVTGRVGVLSARGMVPRWDDDFTSDQGFRPFGSGRFTLVWDGDTARLNLGPGGTVSLHGDAPACH